MNKAFRKISTFLATICLVILCSSNTVPDEGMFPLSEISKLDLKKAGLSIDQTEIYNPKGISIVDALVNISGRTGSFVSDQGLIITNHYAIFSAIQLASSPENDYITNGFSAPTLEKEMEGKGLNCRITDSYEDVSDKIVASTRNFLDPMERTKAINAKIAEIVKAEETKDPTIKAEVSEMFLGKTYVLFRYKMIKDVRLVYFPRQNIAVFGGESDNWVWPRHSGDFAFVRAYVAPDGSPAPYSKQNVPYKPKKFLKINPNGASEEEFVFLLGYPRKTYRHRSSQYLQYQEKYLLPYTANLYQFEIDQIARTSATDKALEIKQAFRTKDLANYMKNFKGKLQGLTRTSLVEQKQKEEEELMAYINNDPKLKERYGNLFTDIDNLYEEISGQALRDLWFGQVFPSTNLLNVANIIANLQIKLNEFSKDQRADYLKDNASKIKSQLETAYSSYVEETDKLILKKMITDALAVPENQRVDIIDKLFLGKSDKAINDYINTLFNKTKLKNEQFVYKIPTMTPEAIAKLKDPMLSFADELNKQLVIILQNGQKNDARLNKLMADLVDVKSIWKKSSFIPDANGTLRLSYGYVRGYSPADAVYDSPFTTLKGILEKMGTGPDYVMTPVVKDLYKKKDFGMFAHPKLHDVPVAFLYNLDTSGGNSGSPVLNNKGELVGETFDLAYLATMGDFAYNESYSRSIGVDIRYILWVAQKVDKADFLLKELGVKTN